MPREARRAVLHSLAKNGKTQTTIADDDCGGSSESVGHFARFQEPLRAGNAEEGGRSGAKALLCDFRGPNRGGSEVAVSFGVSYFGVRDPRHARRDLDEIAD